ncbi:PQQ-dependent sugar dehydrogenase [Aliiruegeria lutimaris]|uniref:Glucose / Sorbosone dehydrogenase n=1 Tax=Aliiruegeria lutimaris TaxID=571298 RepID=A0A1G9FSF3_9RHOB|nr:PQQ-dependent sugar dehydrogenase [Aliiruegeria lutimaris]SDK91043.1 Glucose / Sorbosone dehydrogenase [Aliiruegeria lutimaris]
MKYLKVVLILLVVSGTAFAFGMYSTIKKNAVFDGIVTLGRSVKATVSGSSSGTQDIVLLDFADRSLLDTNRLPFNQKEVRVKIENGRQQQMVAVVKASDTTAIVVSEKGLLFTLTPGACETPDCMKPAGRLVRADGTALDDIYDMLVVPGATGNDYYVSFGQENRAQNTKAFYLSRIQIADTPDPQSTLGVEDVVFESTSFSLENGHADVSGGGALAYDANANRIIMTIGDFGLNGYANRFIGDVPPAQDPENDLGKIHAIDLATGTSEVISIGHRNPQGLTITRKGEIVSTEHGPKGGDEVNIVVAGKNYGWPQTSFGTMYEQYTFPDKPLDASVPHGGYQPPLTAFVPSIGISALLEVQGLHKAWDGDLLIGSLKAQSLYRIRRWDAGHYMEPIHFGDRIRDLEIVDGILLIASDAGKVYMLKPLDDVDMLRTGIGLVNNKNALSECGQCHNLSGARSTEFAPHLVNVFSRPIASLTDFNNYSDGLKGRAEELWTEDNLRAFLADPQSFAPDSGMPTPRLSASDTEEIIALLPLLR